MPRQSQAEQVLEIQIKRLNVELDELRTRSKVLTEQRELLRHEYLRLGEQRQAKKATSNAR